MKKAKALTRRQKIKHKIKKKVTGTAEKPRLVVFRSLKHIYASLVDDVNFRTLVTVSTNSKDSKAKVKDLKTNIEKSKYIGKRIAEKAKELNFNKVVFDRNGYLYHGRIKGVADGAREGGLNF